MNNYLLVDKLKITTPICKFQYPKLIEAETRFNPEGVYKVTALIDSQDAGPVSEQLDGLLARHKDYLKQQAPTQKFKLADLPWGFEEVDGTPYLLVKTKMKASGVDRDGRRWTSVPALFDAKGKPVTDREALRGMWSGTVGRISFEAQPFYQAAIGAGITLRLKAVQVINLVEGGGTADSYGFDEADGWEASSETIPFDGSPSIPDDGDF